MGKAHGKPLAYQLLLGCGCYGWSQFQIYDLEFATVLLRHLVCRQFLYQAVLHFEHIAKNRIKQIAVLKIALHGALGDHDIVFLGHAAYGNDRQPGEGIIGNLLVKGFLALQVDELRHVPDHILGKAGKYHGVSPALKPSIYFCTVSLFWVMRTTFKNNFSSLTNFIYLRLIN